MKKIALIAMAALMVSAASAQSNRMGQTPFRSTMCTPRVATATVNDFVREMPCLNNRGEVIGTELGTICLPYVPRVEGATLYELVSASAREFVFREVTMPQANTPYVFRVNEGASQVVFGGMGDYEVRRADVATEAAGVSDAFVGSYTSHVIHEPVFFLSHDKVQYTDQPVMTTRFRAYFKASILPEGTVLSPDLRLLFLSADGTADLHDISQDSADALQLTRQHVGLQQGTYQIGGRKVEVK